MIGKDWLSVAVLPAVGPGRLTGQGGAASAAAGRRPVRGRRLGGGSGESAAVMGALLGSATRRCTATWGSGRLLRTSLVSVLITNSGHVLVGAVTPSVLYAAAAQVK